MSVLKGEVVKFGRQYHCIEKPYPTSEKEAT